MCNWFDEEVVKLGGTDEAHEMVLKAVVESWELPACEIREILSAKAHWRDQCEARGVSAYGLLR